MNHKRLMIFLFEHFIYSDHHSPHTVELSA